MGQRWIKGLKTRVGRQYIISKRRASLYSGGIHVGGVRGGSLSVMSGDTAGGGSSKSESCQEL